MSTIKLPNVDIQTGYMVTCPSPQCGPIGFAPKRPGAQELKDRHLAEHAAHNKRVEETLAKLDADNKALADKSGVAIEPLLQCPGDNCGAPVGLPHTQECDVARCLVTGTQRKLIDHIRHLEPAEREGHKCGADVWTGYWPGDYEAAQYGMSRNAVMLQGRWDVDRLQWVIDEMDAKKESV